MHLNVFKRDKKRFEFKVVAVLLYAFRIKPQEDLWLLLGALRVSKSSVQDRVNKVEGKLSFEASLPRYSP